MTEYTEFKFPVIAQLINTKSFLIAECLRFLGVNQLIAPIAFCGFYF